MKAVILAAGEGSRMRPLTYARPKVMLPIANRPILEHLVLEMKKVGVDEFVFIVGYRAETIRQHFGDGKRWGVSISYATQRRQSGTAHALGMVENLIRDRFLLANGDVAISAEEIAKITSQTSTAMALVEVKDARGFGSVELSGDTVSAIHEKVERPPSNLVNAGIYLLTGDVFSAIARTGKSARGEYELTDSLQMLMDEGHAIKGVRIGNWLDLSYPWDLLNANETFMKGLESRNLGTIEDNVYLKGAVSIGKGTVVKANSYIIGPVLIGEDCDIGPNCYIRPCTTIGDKCHVGAAVEVKNSIVMKGSKIPHHNYVGDSIIGENCNLGAGTKIANLRLDKKNVVIGNMDTGRHKLGAIIGDNVQTGINASINVGTMIGDGAFVGPGATASGIILPDSQIF